MHAKKYWVRAQQGATSTAHATAAREEDSKKEPNRAAANPRGRNHHRGNKRGTRKEILGFEGDWAKIRYGDTEGYIGKQYLSQSPTAAIRLERATQASEQAKAEVAKLRTQLAQIKGERDALSEQSSELKNALSSRSNELEQLQEVASDPIRLDQANRRLNEELSLLRSELDQVKGENVMLRNNNTSQQWITGVGILIAGLIAGVLMRSRSGRRQRSGWAN
jgi:Small-conductance mechanosensitive channel